MGAVFGRPHCFLLSKFRKFLRRARRLYAQAARANFGAGGGVAPMAGPIDRRPIAARARWWLRAFVLAGMLGHGLPPRSARQCGGVG